ncbi:MAG: peptidoglycan-binding protein [Acidimicrobiia bacterium]|nr:peptidoglycan-binding protein [Acidimicrobiia bacterium]
MRNLSFGDEGPEVSKLQRHLKALSFYTGEVDGVFGEGTQEAVVEFQKVFLVTGWADRVTEELIVRKHAENLIPEPEPEPEPDERPGGSNT